MDKEASDTEVKLQGTSSGIARSLRYRSSEAAFAKGGSQTPHVQRCGKIFALSSARRSSGPSTCFGGKLCDPLDDVLDCRWASDHDDLIAVLQRTRLLLVSTGYQGVTQPYCMGFGPPKELPDGPLYLIEFSGLCAKALCLPSFLQEKDDAAEKNFLMCYEAEPLLQMRKLVDLHRRGKGEPEAPAGLQRAAALAAKFSHPTLWRLVADAALATEELNLAEEALVRCAPLPGPRVPHSIAVLMELLRGFIFLKGSHTALGGCTKWRQHTGARRQEITRSRDSKHNGHYIRTFPSAVPRRAGARTTAGCRC